MSDKINKKNINQKGEEISRREAIGKMGYAAFASSTLFLLLNDPTKVYAQSPGNPSGGGGNNPGDGFGTKSSDSFGAEQNTTQDDWGTGDNDDWQ